jgi:hypothetical protein
VPFLAKKRELRDIKDIEIWGVDCGCFWCGRLLNGELIFGIRLQFDKLILK